MKITNKYLLNKLASYGVYETKPVTKGSNVDKTYIITDVEGNEKQVITDKVTDEEVYLLLEAKKIEVLDSIRGMLKFFVILTIIGMVISFFVLIKQLSGMHF